MAPLRTNWSWWLLGQEDPAWPRQRLRCPTGQRLWPRSKRKQTSCLSQSAFLQVTLLQAWRGRTGAQGADCEAKALFDVPALCSGNQSHSFVILGCCGLKVCQNFCCCCCSTSVANDVICHMFIWWNELLTAAHQPGSQVQAGAVLFLCFVLNGWDFSLYIIRKNVKITIRVRETCAPSLQQCHQHRLVVSVEPEVTRFWEKKMKNAKAQWILRDTHAQKT